MSSAASCRSFGLGLHQLPIGVRDIQRQGSDLRVVFRDLTDGRVFGGGAGEPALLKLCRFDYAFVDLDLLFLQFGEPSSRWNRSHGVFSKRKAVACAPRDCPLKFFCVFIRGSKMKFDKLCVLGLLGFVAACTPEAEMAEAPSAEVAMAANTSVVTPLIGKRLVGETATFIINADGTMGGNVRGEAVVGSYVATSTETCSTYTAPEFLTGREWCSVPVIEGNTVVFNRADGSQSPTYEIQG